MPDVSPKSPCQHRTLQFSIWWHRSDHSECNLRILNLRRRRLARQNTCLQTSYISSSPWLDAASTNSTTLTFTSIASSLGFSTLSAIRASFDNTQRFLDTPPLASKPLDTARRRRWTGTPEPLTSADAPPSNAAAPAAIGSASAPPAARRPAAPAASYLAISIPSHIQNTTAN